MKMREGGFGMCGQSISRVSPHEEMRRRCREDAERMQRRCREDAEKMQRRCRERASLGDSTCVPAWISFRADPHGEGDHPPRVAHHRGDFFSAPVACNPLGASGQAEESANARMVSSEMDEEVNLLSINVHKMEPAQGVIFLETSLLL
ncbi:hypothetical protein PVPAM_060012800 [Plasmodium vivax]|nr:hypothetical protein PVPAM_060012800 [Plasmodium vivax]